MEEWSKTTLSNLEIPLSKIPGKLKLVYFGFSGEKSKLDSLQSAFGAVSKKVNRRFCGKLRKKLAFFLRFVSSNRIDSS
ncbi:hypothetical protein [Leptospira kirschneri]|uniref:hypothetical protein n=1 Tax=Leptospira kirschneri TaxID=29507 RepID=UPI00034BA8CA|nr:hypothetical protein [Leptospira kirschneri]